MHCLSFTKLVLPIAVALTVTIVTPVSPASAVEFALSPSRVDILPGQVFTIELTADASADSLNGYDMVLGYDPSVLILLGAAASQQEGPLFTQACPQRFHKFTIEPDSSIARVAHVLLCAGVKVIGPGVLYRLSFQAPMRNALTHLRLLEGTAAYNAGTVVVPFTTRDAVIAIGDVTTTPAILPRTRLMAYPNPFNPTTTLSWVAPEPGWVRVDLYSLAGRRLSTLWSGFQLAGTQEFSWRADADLASGVYLVRLLSHHLRTTTRVVLLK